VRAACAALAGACLLFASCGDDDEPANTSGATTPTETTETAPAPDTQTSPARTETAPPEEERPPPEEQPGGAGQEEAIRTEARVTGRNGRVRPASVSVPPFIGVRVMLRSADGAPYGLDCAGRRVQVDGDIESASTTVAGRRIGSVLPCRALGDHNDVVIRFSAEPGP
jgi:hypothetical protein